MPVVKVQFYGVLHHVVGEHSTTVEVNTDATLAAVLQALIARYGPPLQQALFDAEGQLQRSVRLSVNDVMVPSTALEKPLGSGTREPQEVSLLLIPPVFGG